MHPATLGELPWFYRVPHSLNERSVVFNCLTCCEKSDDIRPPDVGFLTVI